MRGALGRARLVAGLVKQIARDVAARNPDAARQPDHDVGEVLANALPAFERVIDGRIHACALGHVRDAPTQKLAELEHIFEWIAPAGLLMRVDPYLARELLQQ